MKTMRSILKLIYKIRLYLKFLGSKILNFYIYTLNYFNQNWEKINKIQRKTLVLKPNKLKFNSHLKLGRET